MSPIVKKAPSEKTMLFLLCLFQVILVRLMQKQAPDYGYPPLDLRDNAAPKLSRFAVWTDISKNILNPFTPQHPLYDFRKFLPQKLLKDDEKFRRMTLVRPPQMNMLNLQRYSNKYAPRMSMIKQFKGFSALALCPESPIKKKVTFRENTTKLLTSNSNSDPSKMQRILDQYEHIKRNDSYFFHKMKRQHMRDEVFKDDPVRNHRILLFPNKYEPDRRHSDIILHVNDFNNWKFDDFFDKQPSGVSKVELDSSLSSTVDAEAIIENKRYQPRRALRNTTTVNSIPYELFLISEFQSKLLAQKNSQFFIRRKSCLNEYSMSVQEKMKKANTLMLLSDIEIIQKNKVNPRKLDSKSTALSEEAPKTAPPKKKLTFGANLPAKKDKELKQIAPVRRGNKDKTQPLNQAATTIEETENETPTEGTEEHSNQDTYQIPTRLLNKAKTCLPDLHPPIEEAAHSPISSEDDKFSDDAQDDFTEPDSAQKIIKNGPEDVSAYKIARFKSENIDEEAMKKRLSRSSTLLDAAALDMIRSSRIIKPSKFQSPVVENPKPDPIQKSETTSESSFVYENPLKKKKIKVKTKSKSEIKEIQIRKTYMSPSSQIVTPSKPSTANLSKKHSLPSVSLNPVHPHSTRHSSNGEARFIIPNLRSNTSSSSKELRVLTEPSHLSQFAQQKPGSSLSNISTSKIQKEQDHQQKLQEMNDYQLKIKPKSQELSRGQIKEVKLLKLPTPSNLLTPENPAFTITTYNNNLGFFQSSGKSQRTHSAKISVINEKSYAMYEKRLSPKNKSKIKQ